MGVIGCLAAGIGGAAAGMKAIPAEAGSWQQDQRGWWWQADDGSYPAGEWRWIDGNGDGMAEFYCFDGSVVVGSRWEPGINPYSITPDGDVAKAFGRHGWYWGAAYNTKDFMHFEK